MRKKQQKKTCKYYQQNVFKAPKVKVHIMQNSPFESIMFLRILLVL